MIRFIFLMLVAIPAFSQKEVRAYFDLKEKQIQEIYFVSKEDGITLTGKYQRLYENGRTVMNGDYDGGLKSGVFMEYHENGKIARKLSYVNGQRHGAVEVFNE